MDIFAILSRLIVGIVIGFSIGLTGIGGGVLIIPVLCMAFGLSPSVAVGTAGFYSLLTKSYAAFERYRLKTIDFKVSLYFLIGAIPANIVTATIVNRILRQYRDSPEMLQAIQHNLKLLIVFIMLVSVALMIYRIAKPVKAIAHGPLSLKRKGLGILFGVIIGVLVGSTSIGGAVICIPLMVLFFGLSADRATGSSLLIGVAMTIILSLIYGRGGQVDFTTGAIMALGSFAGVYMGSHLSVKLPDKVLKGIITAIIALAAIFMLLG